MRTSDWEDAIEEHQDLIYLDLFHNENAQTSLSTLSTPLVKRFFKQTKTQTKRDLAI